MAARLSLHKEDPWYKCLVIVLLVCVSVLFCFTLFINFLGTSGILPADWLKNDVGNISDKYKLEITPAGYTFSIWGIIYIWQAAWIVYAMTSLCRRNKYGAVFLRPPIVTPFFLFTYCLNLSFNILWIFLFDNELTVWSLIALFLIYLSLEFGRGANHLSVDNYGQQLQMEHKNDLLAIRILIQNGLLVYRTWALVATTLNLAIVMTYDGTVDQSTSSTVSLSIVTLAVVLDFVLEISIWDRFLRYNFANWGVYVWAPIGILVSDWKHPQNKLSVNFIFAIVLLVLSVILVAVKVPVVIWRHHKQPLYVDDVQPLERSGDPNENSTIHK